MWSRLHICRLTVLYYNDSLLSHKRDTSEVDSLTTNQNEENEKINMVKITITCLLIGLLAMYIKEDSANVVDLLFIYLVSFTSLGATALFISKNYRVSTDSYDYENYKKDLIFLLILNAVSFLAYCIYIYIELESSNEMFVAFGSIFIYMVILVFSGLFTGILIGGTRSALKKGKSATERFIVQVFCSFAGLGVFIWMLTFVRTENMMIFYPAYGMIFGSISILIAAFLSNGENRKTIKYSLSLLFLFAIIPIVGMTIVSFVEPIWSIEASKTYLTYLVIGVVVGSISVIANPIRAKAIEYK